MHFTTSRSLQYFLILLVIIGGGYAYYHFKTKAAQTILTDSSNARPDFEAPLTTSLDLTAGTGSATFSRSDGADRRATVTDWEGLIRPVKNGEARFEGARRVENLAAYSQAIDNAVWSKSNGGTGSVPIVTANYAAAPDGTITAERVQLALNGGTTLSDHSRIDQHNILSTNGHVYTWSLWVKTTDGSTKTVRSDANGLGGGNMTVTGMWQRFSFTATNDADNRHLTPVRLRGAQGTSDSADILVWGIQLEEVTGQSNQNPSEYVSVGVLSAPYHGAAVDGVKYFDYQNGNTVASNVVTEARGADISSSTLKGYLAEGSRTNLMTYSEQLNDASWNTGSLNGTITADATVAPSGQTTAESYVENTTASASHLVYHSFTLAANTTSTASVYAKSIGSRNVRIKVVSASDAYSAYFDLSSGSVISTSTSGTGSVVSASIVPAGNGYYRVSVTGIHSTSAANPNMEIWLVQPSSTTVYTGDGSSGLYLWGAQLEQASFASSYIPTTSASVTRGNDDLTYPIANISNSAGATYAEVTATGSTTSRIISTAGAAGYGQLYFGTSPSIYTATMYDGTNSAGSGVSGAMNAVQKMASKWSGASMKAFQNGTAGSAGTYDGAFDTSGNNIALLITSNGANPTFGTIKNVKIWKQAMSDTFLQNLTAGQAGVEKKATGKVANDLGLVGYWSFEDGSGTKATDFSGRGNTGTLTNMEAGDWTDGRLGKGLDFDGVNEYVSLGNNALGNPGDASTVSAWVKTSVPGQEEIISEYQSGVCGDYTLRISGGKLYVHDGGSATVSSVTSSLSNGQWHHVIAVSEIDGTKLYIDGVLDTSSTTDVDWRNTCSAQDVQIGRRMDGGNLYTGSLDEVRVYNRALSQDEITKLYQTGAAKINVSQNTKSTNGLVGLWSFNGPDVSGTTASDRSGSGNNGTLTNGPLVRPGKVGQALSFDGVDDRVVVAATPNTTSFSLSSWVKVDGNQTGYDRIVDLGDRRGALMFADGTKAVYAYANIIGQGDVNVGSFTMTAGTWHHFVGIFDYDSSTIKLYADGNLVGTPATITGTQQPGTDLYIGSENGSQYFMNGLIDEVRLYNRALSADEVQNLYNMGR